MKLDPAAEALTGIQYLGQTRKRPAALDASGRTGTGLIGRE